MESLEKIKTAIGIAPFYADEAGVIYCADCLDVMKKMPDGCIDLVLTDPNYGIRICRNTKSIGVARDRGRKATDESWDDIPATSQQIKELMRVSENQIVFGANYFWECFYSSQCYIVWDKRGNMPEVPFCETEFAWTSFIDKPSKRYVVINHGFVRDSKETRTGHPCQKPLPLFEKIVSDFSNLLDLIFDPFLGSGTTAIACKKLGRKYVGIEQKKDYCQIAKERLIACDTGVSPKEQRAGQKALF